MQQVIHTHQLCRFFEVGDTKVHALDHVDLSVNQGDFVAVMGPSGSGKSTLMNILLPLRYSDGDITISTQRARKLLDRLGMSERMDHRPNQLSGGQRQRVAIARALVAAPPLLLADEPTGNLDSKTSIEIMDLFTELNGEGQTVLMVTHEDDVAAYAKRVIHMRDGKIEREHLNAAA